MASGHDEIRRILSRLDLGECIRKLMQRGDTKRPTGSLDGGID